MSKEPSPAVPSSGEGPQAELVTFRAELRKVFRPPFAVIQIVLFNMALVLFCWYVLGPETITRLSGVIFLPAVLASWAFADVPATNLFGVNPAAAMAVLDDPVGLRRLIFIRNLVLWLVVSPITAFLAILLAWDMDAWQTGILVCAIVLGLPMGFFGATAIMAPLLPYHELAMKVRVRRRDTWVRWAVAVVLPYFLINPAALVLMLPGYLMYHALDETPFAAVLGILVIAAWTWAFRRLTIDYTLRLTARRRDWLAEFLPDPSRG
jgi:hypothetical protein